MAGMAAEGREIPIADRELTRGRRGTHSDRAHHHRRWFRAPARCRSETGAPSRPRVLLSWGYAVSTASRRSMPVGDRRSSRRPPLGGRFCFCSWGYAVSTASRRSMPVGDRRSAVRALLLSWGYAVSTASRRSMPVGDRRSAVRALLLSWGYAVSTASRRSMPVGDRRSAVRALLLSWVRALLLSWGTRFRPPPGGRCRSETGAPPSARFCSVGGTRFRPPLGGRCRSETGAPPSARFCSVGGTRFRPPLGGRCRSETGAPPSPCLFALDDARSRCASRSEKSGLLGVSLLRLRLCVTPRQGSAQRSCPGFPSHCRFQRAAVLQGSAVAGESQQSRRFSGTARHVLRARPRQRSGKGAPSPPQGSL